MEYMDYTLDAYIAKYNSTLTIAQRKGIAQQIYAHLIIFILRGNFTVI